MMPANNQKRILVIEDNVMNLELARDLLSHHGYLINSAGDEDECRQQLEQAVPDLILMDMQLPGKDGYALAKELKQDQRYQAIPIVAVTAYAMVEDQERAKEAGCAGIITKPIDTRLFPDQVKHYLEGNESL